MPYPRTRSPIAGALTALVICAALLQCSHDSTGPDQHSPQPPPVTVGDSTVTVQIGTDLPPSAIARLRILATAVASATLSSSPSGETITIRIRAGQEHPLLFALDSEGTPVLATFPSPTGGRLDLASTAEALAMLSLGPVATRSSLSEKLPSAVRDAPSFQTLASMIRESLAKGGTPATDKDVRTLAAGVASEALQALAPQGQMGVAPLSRWSVPPSRSTTPSVTSVPYSLVTSSVVPGGLSKLRRDDVTGAGVNLLNFTLVPWQVESTDTDMKSVDVQDVSAWDFDPWTLLTLSGLPTPVALYGRDERFTVTARQTATTQGESSITFMFGGLLAVFDYAAKQPSSGETKDLECVRQIASQILTSNLAALMSQGTGDAALAYMKSVAISAWSEYPDLVKHCGVPEYFVLESQEQFVKALITTVFPVSAPIASGLKTASWLVLGAQIVEFWNTSKSAIVCKNQGKIEACGARKLVITPDGSFLPLGQSRKFTATVIDSVTGKLITPVPAITWSLDNGAAAALDADGETAVVKAIASGTIRVIASEKKGAADTVTVIAGVAPPRPMHLTLLENPPGYYRGYALTADASGNIIGLGYRLGTPNVYGPEYFSAIVAWSPPSYKPRILFELGLYDDPQWITAFPDGAIAYYLHGRGLYLWTPAEGIQLVVPWQVAVYDVSPNGEYLLNRYDGHAYIWNEHSGLRRAPLDSLMRATGTSYNHSLIYMNDQEQFVVEDYDNSPAGFWLQNADGSVLRVNIDAGYEGVLIKELNNAGDVFGQRNKRFGEEAGAYATHDFVWSVKGGFEGPTSYPGRTSGDEPSMTVGSLSGNEFHQFANTYDDDFLYTTSYVKENGETAKYYASNSLPYFWDPQSGFVALEVLARASECVFESGVLGLTDAGVVLGYVDVFRMKSAADQSPCGTAIDGIYSVGAFWSP